MEETIELRGHEISVETLEQAIENFVDEHGTSGPYQNVSEYHGNIIIVADSFPDEDVMVLHMNRGEVFFGTLDYLKEMLRDMKGAELIDGAKELFGHYDDVQFQLNSNMTRVEVTFPQHYKLTGGHVESMELFDLQLAEVRPEEGTKLCVVMEKNVDASE